VLEQSRPRKSAPLKKRNAGPRGSRVERKWQRRSLLNQFPFCLTIFQSICPKNPFLKLTSINILQKFHRIQSGKILIYSNN